MYCDTTDIEKVLTPAIVAQLADDDGDGVADADVVQRAVQVASSLIDSYCSGRYPTPFHPVPDIIRSTSAKMAAYFLLSRRGFDPGGADKAVVAGYENAETWLRDVAAGKAHVPVTGATPEPPQQPTRVHARRKLFGERTLDRW